LTKKRGGVAALPGGVGNGEDKRNVLRMWKGGVGGVGQCRAHGKGEMRKKSGVG